jgi:chromosome partitioning protein
MGLDDLWRLIEQNSGRGIGLAVASIAGAIAWILLRQVLRLVQQFLCFLQSRQRTLRAVGREISKDGAREGQGVWLTRPIYQPDGYQTLLQSPKVLAIANLKGGVGKTTLTANLGAYYAKEWGKRVLLVDLDFQGSLSSMAFPKGDWVPPPGQNSNATKLISNDVTPDLVPALARSVDLGDDYGKGRLAVITAYYDLAQADNRILVEWLLRCRRSVPNSFRHMLADLLVGKLFRSQDVRYTLSEILHSKAVLGSFELVLIDCPPRLTTGEIQAFCAASHLLIPTILDRPSAEAVASMCGQIETLKREGICPHLSYIGVVGTMTKANVNYAEATNRIRDALQANGVDAGLLLSNTFVPHTVEMVREADEGIAYLFMTDGERHRRVRGAIDQLASYIANQMGVPTPPRLQ